MNMRAKKLYEAKMSMEWKTHGLDPTASVVRGFRRLMYPRHRIRNRTGGERDGQQNLTGGQRCVGLGAGVLQHVPPHVGRGPTQTLYGTDLMTALTFNSPAISP